MTNNSRDKLQPVVATIGDATFLQSGVAGLADAVRARARFILVILDNRTNENGARRKIPALVRECGVSFLREINPCNQDTFRATLRQAVEFAQSESGGVAVIVANRPCVEPHECEKCYDGFVVEANPMSIFELAQQVALEKKIAPRNNGNRETR